MKLIRTFVPVLLMCAQAVVAQPLPAHPRLLFGTNDLADLRARRFTTHTNEWQNMIRLCDLMKSHTELPAQNIDSDTDVRRYSEWLLDLSLVQLIDPAQPYDSELADFFFTMLRYDTWDEVPIWNGYDLVVGHFLLALAVTYDWHYNDFTPEERTEIRDRLSSYTDRALQDLYDLRNNPNPPDSDARRLHGNHMWINCAGVAAVNYALRGEVDESRRLVWEARLDQAFSNVCRFLVRDGSGMEGNAYHSYGLASFERWMEIRRRERGEPETAFYQAIPWFTNTTFFTLYSIEPGGADSYGGVAMFGDSPQYFFNPPSDFQPLLAARLRCPYAQWLAARSDFRIDWEEYQTVWPYLWFDPTVSAAPPNPLPRWRHFDDYGMFTWRSSWSNNATYFSLKSGKHIVGHGHPDDGNFVFQRAGVPYLVDLGYSFKKQTEDHNVLLVNGSGQYGSGNTWDLTSPSNRWGHILSVLADDRAPAGSSGFFDVVCDPKPTYTNTTLTSWLRETVGLGDLLLMRDTVSASSSVRFDLLLHSSVVVPSEGLYDFTEHRTENPWTSLGGARWSIAPDASRSTEPALVVADLSASGAWAATTEHTMFVPEQIPPDAGGGYNDAAVAYQFGWNLRRSLTTTQGRSLVAMGFNDQISGWTIGSWGYSGAEGTRVTTGGATVISVLWPDGGVCSGSGGWDVNGQMAGRRYAQSAGEPRAMYFGRDVTWVRDNGITLFTSTAPVSVYSRMEHTSSVADPHQARLISKSASTVSMFCSAGPGGVTLNGTPVSFTYAGNLLTFTLPAAGSYDLVTTQGTPPPTPPALACSVSALTASVTQGLNAASQAFDVWNSASNVLTYSIADNVTWLSVSPTNGTSTGAHNSHGVAFTTASLAAGTYQGTITVAAPGADNAPKTIAVTLTVLSPPPPPTPPALACSVSALTASVTQGLDAASQVFEVWNSGSNVLNYAISESTAWFTVSPATGTSAGEHDTLAVAFSTASLGAGTYAGTITVTASGAEGSPKTIEVTLTVQSPPPPPTPPALACSVSALTASVTQGLDAVSQAFDAWNAGSDVLDYTISDDADWLAVSPEAGSSAGEHDDLTVTLGTASLDAGTYTATITVAAPDADNSPKTIGVTLTVLSPPPPPLTPPALACSASALSVSTTQGMNVASQSFAVWNAGSDVLSYTISDNAAWLSVGPAGGASIGEHNTHSITFSTASLVAGTYTAAITLSAPGADGSPTTLAVTLTVQSPPVLPDVNFALESRGSTITGNSGANWGKLIDGVVTGYTGSSGYGYTYWRTSRSKTPGAMVLDLKAVRTVNRMKLLLWNLDNRYYQYKIESARRSNGPWTLIVDRLTGQNKGWQDVSLASPVSARYLRLTGTYGSANYGFHVVEWEVYGTLLSAAPFLSCDTDALSVTAVQGQNATSQLFDVWNDGEGILSYSISDDVSWLSVSPAQGTSPGTAVTHTVSFGTSTLAPGSYKGVITISAGDSVKAIDVMLNVVTVPDSNLALASRGSTITGGNGANWSKLIDGIASGYTGKSGFGYTLWRNAAGAPGSMVIDLKGVRTISQTKFLLWDLDSRYYYQYKIEASTSSASGPWTVVADHTAGQSAGWQILPFSSPIQARYLRMTGTYDSVNDGFYVVEWEVQGH